MIRKFKIITYADSEHVNYDIIRDISEFCVKQKVWVNSSNDGYVSIKGFVAKENQKDFSHFVRHTWCAERNLVMVNTRIW